MRDAELAAILSGLIQKGLIQEEFDLDGTKRYGLGLITEEIDEHGVPVHG